MAYFGFQRIEPPAPNDPLVNEVTQLNNNWDILDAKLKPYYNGGTISNIEQGQEYFNTDFNFTVWNGTAPVIPDNIPDGWTAWTDLPVLSPRAIRSGFTPRWRNNPLYRMAELSGGFQFNAAADPWTMGANFLLNADSAGSPPASFVPIGGKHIQPCSVGLTTGTTIVAGGYVTIEVPAGSTFTRIRFQHLGGPTAGNFMAMDQVWWWY